MNSLVFMLILQSIIPVGITNLDFADLSPDDLDKKTTKKLILNKTSLTASWVLGAFLNPCSGDSRQPTFLDDSTLRRKLTLF